MTPEQRLEQAVKFMEWPMRPLMTPESVGFYLLYWASGKDFSREDEREIRRYIVRLMKGEDPEGMICTDLEQTGDAA